MQLLEKTQAETNTKAVDTKQACPPRGCQILADQLIPVMPKPGGPLNTFWKIIHNLMHLRSNELFIVDITILSTYRLTY